MIEVRVPATSANMGPGFDCLGIALNMFNNFYIEEIDKGFEITGCGEEYRNSNNLVYTSMLRCFEEIGYNYGQRGYRIKIEASIPVSRGLGSSAACILGGVLAANEIGGGNLSKDEILEIAARIEGHPDNVSTALFGGMQASIEENGRFYHESIHIADGLKFCTIIPDFTLSTKEARAVLPKSMPHKDAVFNVGRTSLLIAALTSGNFDLLKYACRDKLHQPYRGGLIRNYNEVVEESVHLKSLGVFLSGAGPTIMALLKEDDNEFSRAMEAFISKLEDKWNVQELNLCSEGAEVKR